MKTKILLVDDHKILREGLRALIEKHEELELIDEAENGRMAVQLACKLKPDVVIMDVSMPELNGIEAVRKILAKEPGIKILALSMYSDKQYVAGMLKAGASGYLLKENAFEDLIVAIRTIVANQKYICPAIEEIVIDDYIDHLKKETELEESVLTSREREVLQLIAEGINTKQVAQILNISIKTVEVHRHNIMEKLKIQSIPDLTKYAIRKGLTSLDL